MVYIHRVVEREDFRMRISQPVDGRKQVAHLRGIAILLTLGAHFSLLTEFFPQRGLACPFYSGVEIFF